MHVNRKDVMNNKISDRHIDRHNIRIGSNNKHNNHVDNEIHKLHGSYQIQNNRHQEHNNKQNETNHKQNNKSKTYKQNETNDKQNSKSKTYKQNETRS